MLAGWRHAYANIALTGGNLAFLLIALRSPTPAGLGITAALVGITSFYAWHANLRRYRSTADTPTSRISSAPQGYVEIVGIGKYPAASKLVSPISGLPCLWYRYVVDKKSGNKWHRVGSGESTEVFSLDDGSGNALIDPAGAEIITTNKQVTINGQYRNTEWTLIEHETLYVLGEHATIGGANAALDSRQDTSDLLAAWKHEEKELLARFDKDGSGNIDMKEWQLARLAARLEIERRHDEARLEQGIHVLRKPSDRLFLISNHSPDALEARYRMWAWVHLSLFTFACLALASLL